jgi:hypothetical protein
MFRFLVAALVALGASAPAVHAQHTSGGHGHGSPGPGSLSHGPFAFNGGLPLSPGVMPGSPFGPGTQFLPPPRPVFVPSRSTQGGFTNFGARSGFGFGGYGYGGYYGYPGYGYGYDPGYDYDVGFPDPVIVSVPVRPYTPVIVSGERSATLTVELPPGAAPNGYTLTSPLLKPGDQYTFNVNVRWTLKGKTFEAKHTVTAGPGDKSRLMIVSGDEVKE